VRVTLLALAVAVLAAGCSSDKPAPVANTLPSDQVLKKDCSDPHWREQNLGLWYSVCRQPLNW
jgi:hypothetical protein